MSILGQFLNNCQLNIFTQDILSSSGDMLENVDTMQQMTSGTPAPRPKNRKRVAAGKAIAEKTRQAREAQKKAFAEAQIIIANQNVQKKADPPVPETTRNVLTTTQWLRVISIFVSVLEIYYKREQSRPSPQMPKAPSPSPVDATEHHLNESRASKKWNEAN